MTLPTPSAETTLQHAVDIIRRGDVARNGDLDAIATPLYLADAEGVVTYYNRACIDFAGREPRVGEDRWCVTWKLFTHDDEALPHDHCPMAVAIQEQRPVRGAGAVAERPDGSRVSFVPYPTPLYDEAGRFAGAINLLVDVTDAREADSLRSKAKRCRRLATGISDAQAENALEQLAREYDTRAGELSPKT